MNDRLVVDGVDIDISQAVAFPLSFSISDIKEPQKRKRNLSKSIRISGTQRNLNFFSSTYALSLTDVVGDDIGFNFDPTQRVEAKYYKSGILVFDGLLQLNDVVLAGKNYEFNCTLFSNFIDIFMKLGDLKVSELGWSAYDHTLTRANIIASWTAPTGSGYVYPLVDYGYNVIAPTTWSIGNLVPMVYAREIISKCLELSSVEYTSTFLETDLFKQLVLGFEGGIRSVFSATELGNRQIILDGVLDVNRDVTQSFANSNYTNTTIYNLLSNPNFTETVITDNTNQYDDVTGEITINQTGTYSFNYNGTITQKTTNPNSLTFEDGSQFMTFLIKKNGSLMGDVSTGFDFTNNDLGLVLNNTITLNCNSGDIITFQIVSNVSFNYTETNSFINTQVVNLAPITLTVNCINQAILDGDIVELTTSIPDIKAVDFLSGIIKMFNLYVSDPDLLGLVTIEPLEDYYQPTNTFNDWTQKIDYSKEFKIVPSSNIGGKNYNFMFQKEDDFDNETYRNEFNARYGDKKYVVQSTFQTGDRDYLLPFGQAIPIELTNTNLITPRIIKDGKPFKGKPKLYFYNGLKDGDFRLTDADGVAFQDLTQYPSVHHFDDWENPSFDLNFELPKRIYYGNASTLVTTDNLFSRYHEKFIREITGRDSKIVECYAKLTNSDVASLDFSKLIMINGVLYRLNEVKEFDSNVADSTQIELIRIIEASSPKVNQVVGIKVPLQDKIQPNGNTGVVISGGYQGVGKGVKVLKG